MEQFHIVPYPLPGTNPSRNPRFENHFRKVFAKESSRHELKFEGYWVAIQLYGGERGLSTDLPTLGPRFIDWAMENPDVMEEFRDMARRRGFENAENATADTMVYADVMKPLTVSEKEAKKYYAKYAQPRWIRNRKSHVAHRLNYDWPCVDAEWQGPNDSAARPSDAASNIDAQRDNKSEETEPPILEFDPSRPLLSDGDDGLALHRLRYVLSLHKRAMSGTISWDDFVRRTEAIAASMPASEGDRGNDAASLEVGDTESSLTVTPSLEADESRIDEAAAEGDAANGVNPRKRALEEYKVSNGARPRPRPGPTYWAADFYEEVALDMSRTLSDPGRRLSATRTTYGGHAWYILIWGGHAAAMSAGIARAVQWIFKEHIEGSARWSGLSLRFILKFSRMGQFAVVANASRAPLSPEAMEKLAEGARAGMVASTQSSVAAQARTAAAMLARLMEGGGEGAARDGDGTSRLQRMMGLCLADLIAEGEAMDDPIVAAILGGDPAEYGMGHGDRAVSPEVIDLG